MTLLALLLKIIAHFRLSSTEEQQQMAVDVQQWEKTAVADSDNKLKAMYGKIHFANGPWMRIANSFLFFFAVRYFKEMISDNDDPFEE